MVMSDILKIGARGSPLSLAQTGLVARALEEAHPGLKTEIISIKTTGDKMRNVSLARIGGKGVFVKEIEEALLAGEIDLAVHSAKDLPSELPAGLSVGAVPPRADFRDVLITRRPGGLAALPRGARLGTSGPRRQAQMLAARPDLVAEPIRGNVVTRLKKLKTEVEAIILAAAGLDRLGLSPPNSEYLPPEIMLPSAGQGALAVEIRAEDLKIQEFLSPLTHRPTFLALAAERGFLRRLGSGCQLPAAALARYEESSMSLEGLVASPDGRRIIRRGRTVELDSTEAAANFGQLLATEILDNGGREIMAEVEGS
ncbi:MAG: hydroxymethylbilane synthase [Candidatus Adiutrix sp.]|jgi:hydroxymethylbilane synthase|nr:hydroxymethylbilane synthase [Candidatus Adiutrix sp.]